MKPTFDRASIHVLPLSERVNKLDVRADSVDPDGPLPPLSPDALLDVRTAAAEIRRARARNAPVMLAFGAHSIKNGLSRVMMRLMDGGFVTHFATNGAGVIHDWEFAFQGKSGEDVKRYVAMGQFGIWEETGACLNLALAVGAWRGLGYGESVGAMVLDDGLRIPADGELADAVRAGAEPDADPRSIERAAAAADLRALLRGWPDLPGAADSSSAEPGPADARPANPLSVGSGAARHIAPKPGFLEISHPWKDYCLSAAARRAGIPFTCHPMFGHDIIYTHPANRGAPVGRTAERDFLSFVASVAALEGGVYLSVGSAVMSPMIFEKALSMARNDARFRGAGIEDFSIHVVDLAKSAWDWMRDGEPPQDDPAYYLRFCKTFSRMGGRMSYASCDNRAWLCGLLRTLEG